MKLNRVIIALSLLSPSFLCMGMDFKSDRLYAEDDVAHLQEPLLVALAEVLWSVTSAELNINWANTNGCQFPQTKEKPTKPSKILPIIENLQQKKLDQQKELERDQQINAIIRRNGPRGLKRQQKKLPSHFL